VKVSSLFVNCLSIIGEKAASRRIALEMCPTDELGAVQVDVRKVKQILYNLLSNAVKFTSEGGQVALHVRRVPRDEVGKLSGPWTGRSLVVDAVVDAQVSEFLEISVTDSGIGISREGLEHLFEPFSQIDSGLARKYVGTGLGLVMVRLLSELHGGGVAVTSATGEGSCFTVWLPFRTQQARARPSSQAPSTRALEAHRAARVAMMVGSDLDSANRMRFQLEAEGFEVLHAASADAAVTLALGQPLSLIALDSVLPSMAGWQFLRRLKQLPALARIPVVIASSRPELDKSLARGAIAILPPLDFDPVRFAVEVRRAMGSS
jgi:CheY-like chemotaxis protein